MDVSLDVKQTVRNNTIFKVICFTLWHFKFLRAPCGVTISCLSR